MADGGIILPGAEGSARHWSEPDPFGCEYFIPLNPERRARNVAILAEAGRKLTLDNFNQRPYPQPPALTED